MGTTEQTAATPTGTWTLDPVHSDVGFAVAYSGFGTFRGTFDEFDAKLVDGAIEGSAKVSSVRIDDPNFAAHLLSPDFFDAEQNPELRFTSSSVERNGDEVTIEGELTLRGETKSVTISGTFAGPSTDPYGNERIAFDVGTTVDRTDYGISWNADLPTGDPALGNDVKITANLAFVQA
ncbi:MAG: YceI family protein [Actinomycetota bacterium]|nr:YceI family protein [Actinomycetota bacterium]